MQKEKSNFWSFNVGHLLVLLTWLISGAFYVGEQKNVQANQSKVNDELVQKIDRFNDQIIKLDREGTQLARVDSTRILSLDNRVTRLEEYIPKITTLDVRLNEMSSLLKEVRDDIRKLTNK